jgi:molecular chaperone GrpE
MTKKRQNLPEEPTMSEGGGSRVEEPAPGEDLEPSDSRAGEVEEVEPRPSPELEAGELEFPEPDDEVASEDRLRQDFQALQEETDRLRDQHLRLAADFENYRKRVNADLTGVWARAQAELVKSLVEGLDDLQRVSQFTSENANLQTLIEGVDLVERKLLKALTDAGLEVMVPEGQPFDPNLMEAMMRVPAEEEGQDETVHQVFQKGYRFKDQLVRPARVSVYKDDD